MFTVYYNHVIEVKHHPAVLEYTYMYTTAAAAAAQCGVNTAEAIAEKKAAS